MVRLMVASLRKQNRLAPSAPVFLTHMARTLHGSQSEIEAQLEPPLIAAYDGFCEDVLPPNCQTEFGSSWQG